MGTWVTTRAADGWETSWVHGFRYSRGWTVGEISVVLGRLLKDELIPPHQDWL